MARFNHPFIRPGEYDLGKGRHRSFTRDELTEIASQTQALLEAGYRIPVLAEHSAPGSTTGGPRKIEPDAEDNSLPEGTVGWLLSLHQNEEGTLHYEIELPRPAEADNITAGKMAHTSPEIRAEYIDNDGKAWGPLIAHVALTDHPRYEGQPPLQRAKEAPSAEAQSLQDANATDQEQEETLPEDGISLGDLIDDASMQSSDAVEAINTLPEPTEKEKTSTPSEEQPSKTPLVEKPETDEASEVIPPTGAAEAALGPDEFEEAANTNRATLPQRRAYRDALLVRIQQSRHIPLGLRRRLADAVSAVQLSRDGEEEPTLRLSDAVTLIEEALPEQAMLDPSLLVRANHPHGESFFRGGAGTLSDEEAASIAREQLQATGFSARQSAR